MSMQTPFCGVNAEAVIRAIRNRTSRGHRDDGRKLGLVVEGGAMRGVISAGALTALEELGLTCVFDEVYGASAGAMNAAYFLAGQAAYGTSIYYQDINSGRFINRLRPWKIMDVDYVFDVVVRRVKALRIERVLSSSTQLFVAVTDAATGESVVVEAHAEKESLEALLNASTAMSVLYGRAVEINGRQYIDGGLTNSIPVSDAIRNGCTDVLVLLTRGASYVARPGAVEAMVARLLLRLGNPVLIEAFEEGWRREAESRDIALGRLRSTTRGVNIATFIPREGCPVVGRTTKRTRALKAAATMAATQMMVAITGEERQVVEVLRFF